MAKNTFDGGDLLRAMANALTDEEADEIEKEYGSAELKAVFGDEDLLSTCFYLFENDLNVSRTARKLYMHRNTLIYRINKLKEATNLNICSFGDAVKFLALYNIHKRGLRNKQ